jgi:anti-anti-sigma regulatory factor
VARFREIQEKNIDFFLINMKPTIQNVFKVVGLDEILNINPVKDLPQLL